MRIDKFLWSVRIYKTRSIATDEIKKNRVSIGGQFAKASKEVKQGDTIFIKKNQIELNILFYTGSLNLLFIIQEYSKAMSSTSTHSKGLVYVHY